MSDAVPPMPAMTPDNTPVARTSGWAIGSLVTGIMGFLCLPPVLPTLFAIVSGIVSLTSIRKSEGRLTGSGLAVAGLVLGIAAIFTNLFGVFLFFAGKMGYDVAMTMNALNPAIQRQDWDKLADELGGPGGLSKEEIRSKLEAGFAEYGKPKSAELARLDADQSQARSARDVFKMPLVLGVNLDCESGPANVEFRLHRVDGKMRATEVRFSKGHLPVRIRGSDFD